MWNYLFEPRTLFTSYSVTDRTPDQTHLIQARWTAFWRIKLTFSPAVKCFWFNKRKLEPRGGSFSPVASAMWCLKPVPAALFSATFITCACENIIFFIFYLALAFTSPSLRPTGAIFWARRKKKGQFSGRHNFEINATYRNGLQVLFQFYHRLVLG